MLSPFACVLVWAAVIKCYRLGYWNNIYFSQFSQKSKVQGKDVGRLYLKEHPFFQDIAFLLCANVGEEKKKKHCFLLLPTKALIMTEGLDSTYQ